MTKEQNLENYSFLIKEILTLRFTLSFPVYLSKEQSTIEIKLSKFVFSQKNL